MADLWIVVSTSLVLGLYLGMVVGGLLYHRFLRQRRDDGEELR